MVFIGYNFNCWVSKSVSGGSGLLGYRSRIRINICVSSFYWWEGNWYVWCWEFFEYRSYWGV